MTLWHRTHCIVLKKASLGLQKWRKTLVVWVNLGGRGAMMLKIGQIHQQWLQSTKDRTTWRSFVFRAANVRTSE